MSGVQARAAGCICTWKVEALGVAALMVIVPIAVEPVPIPVAAAAPFTPTKATNAARKVTVIARFIGGRTPFYSSAMHFSV
jgi:hypothetical protein